MTTNTSDPHEDVNRQQDENGAGPEAGSARDSAMFARRRSSFGAAATAYADHRPDYPEAGVRWALAPAAAAKPGPLDVLDLGAGTGKLSASLVALGHRVTAVEPDPGMREELHRRMPSLTALAGGAEEIPLPDASVDAVVAGQAFHWFDQRRALPEIARVLRPGGVLAALWNTDDDRVPWIAAFSQFLLGRRTFTGTMPVDKIEPYTAYAPVERGDFPHSQPRTADSLVATLATHSHVLVLEPPEREALLDRARAYLADRPETATGSFDLALVTRVERCVRLPG